MAYGKTHGILVATVVAFAAGGVVGFYLPSFFASQCGQDSGYVNVAVRCGPAQVISKERYDALREEITAFIDTQNTADAIHFVSVYFVDLQSGPVWGVNPDAEFIPASLLKLPVAMALFKLAESRPDIMSRTLTLTPEVAAESADQAYNPLHEAESGEVYTVKDLISTTLIDSDNRSYDLLLNFLESLHVEEDLSETFLGLGIVASNDRLAATMTTRAYASIYRQLYNASYLSLKDSEEILGMLIQSSFDKGIAAGVPRSVPVANKFGERYFGEIKQLHDCGIVYYPGNPYLLCVMTQGEDWQDLEKFITEISRRVYEEVDSRRL